MASKKISELVASSPVVTATVNDQYECVQAGVSKGGIFQKIIDLLASLNPFKVTALNVNGGVATIDTFGNCLFAAGQIANVVIVGSGQVSFGGLAQINADGSAFFANSGLVIAADGSIGMGGGGGTISLSASVGNASFANGAANINADGSANFSSNGLLVSSTGGLNINAGSFIAGSDGSLTTTLRKGLALTSITVTASPFSFTAPAGTNLFVFVKGGTVSNITINGTSISTSVSGDVLVPLQAGETVIVTYTVAPVMLSKPY